MKFNVMLQVLVNVKFENVEADSQQAAIEAASNLVDPSELAPQGLRIPIGAAWVHVAEDPPAYALVDEVGDEEYERSRWYFNDPGAGWRLVDPLDNSSPTR